MFAYNCMKSFTQNKLVFMSCCKRNALAKENAKLSKGSLHLMCYQTLWNNFESVEWGELFLHYFSSSIFKQLQVKRTLNWQKVPLWSTYQNTLLLNFKGHVKNPSFQENLVIRNEFATPLISHTFYMLIPFDDNLWYEARAFRHKSRSNLSS